MKSKEEFKNKVKTKRGITLIALVVTIVIIFIITGVTVNMIAGEEGVLKQSQKAHDIQKEQVNQDDTEVNGLLNELDEVNANRVTLPLGWDGNKVIPVRSEDNAIVPVPKGFTASTVDGEKSVSEGFVIKQNGTNNEFVWVPYKDFKTTYPMFSNRTESGKKVNIGQLYDYNIEEKKVTKMNGVSNFASEDYREPDILNDYDGENELLEILGLSDINAFKSQLQTEFDEMKESVETYGGFYIGRYETGNLSTTAVVQKNNTDIAGQNWYTMYQKSKEIANGTSATSSMIWGCQWDATLNWFVSQGGAKKEYVFDSTGKGSYWEENEGNIIATGYIGYDVNNIFDMAGNVLEWTLEAYHSDGRGERRR